MTACVDPILIRHGRYRIIALRTDDEDDHGQIIGYAVLTSAGARLRHALTLDDAKAWLDAFIEQEDIRPPAPPSRTKQLRTSRR